jgi:hypothetical protein
MYGVVIVRPLRNVRKNGDLTRWTYYSITKVKQRLAWLVLGWVTAQMTSMPSPVKGV